MNLNNQLDFKLFNIFIIFIFGLILGFVAKLIEAVPHFGYFGDLLNIIGHIFSELGIWIFVSTIISVWSKNPKLGAIRVFFFFVGMLISYYTYSTFLFGFFPKHYFLVWGGFALFSLLYGYIIWYSRDYSWIGAFCAAIPIGYLARGYIFYRTLYIPHGFNFLMAIVLFFIISKTLIQRLRILLIMIIIILIIQRYNILAYLFGGL